MSTIAQNLQTIATAKANIATAINNKGGSVTSSTPLSAYSAAIDAIPSGGGGGVPDWSEIGYSGAPQSVLDGHAYAKNIYDNWDATKTSLLDKFFNDKQLVYMPLVDTSKVTTMKQMFGNCTSLTTIPQLNTSACTDMSQTYNNCSNLTSIPLLDTSNVTTMGNMFTGCGRLTSIPQFNTSACTSMYQMLSGCTSLTSVPQFDTSKVTSMQQMFAVCTTLTTVPQLNTSACTTMQSMFGSCSRLTSIPQLDTSKVTTMQSMFSTCSALISVPQLNTSACTNMNTMFNSCSALEKIEGLDFTSVTSITNFFGTSNNTTLRYALFKNLGTTSGLTSYDFSRARNWGVADSTYTDARQSLVDSLLTYSYNRATAGYSTCTIKLSTNSYNQLTAQEISGIEAKGYTITT